MSQMTFDSRSDGVLISILRWGLQDRVENFIHTTERRLFTNFHRQVKKPNKQTNSNDLAFHKLSHSYIVFVSHEESSKSGVLLDGSVPRDDDGRHPGTGGGDQEGAGRGEVEGRDQGHRRP